MNDVEHNRTQQIICRFVIDCLDDKKIQIQHDGDALGTTKETVTTALRTELDPDPIAGSTEIQTMAFQIQQEKQWIFGQASKLTRKARRLQNELNRLLHVQKSH